MATSCGSDDQTSLGSILADGGTSGSFLEPGLLLPVRLRRLDDPGGLILATHRLAFSYRCVCLALYACSRRSRQLDEAAGHPVDVIQQFVALVPDRLSIGLKLAHSLLRILPARRQIFL